MNIPQVANIDKFQEAQTVFAGYNHNLVINDTEFYNMKNMTGDYYPVLSPRKRRGFIQNIPNCKGLIVSEAVAWIQNSGTGDKFYYGGIEKLNMPITNGGQRTMLTMGARIIIFPDKVAYNTASTGSGNWEYLESTWHPTVPEGSYSTIQFQLATLTGAEMQNTASSSPPSSPSNGDYWIDTSGETPVLKVYSEYQDEWGSVASTYVKIIASGIDDGFNVNDAVDISGLSHNELNGSFVIWAKGENWILVTAIMSDFTAQNVTDASSVTVSRTMPAMDYVVESENRLWGCKWDNTINEIFASAQGDPTNWQQYMGTSMDSYYLEVGSDGPFTGATVHGGYVMFFKDNVIHKLYGSKPSNYQLTNVTARGISAGSSKSAVIVNETLYYLSKNGICQYGGGSPSGIYSRFGGVRYKNGVAGRLIDKYYISMQDKSNNWHLFTYDEVLDQWYKEDSTQFKFCCENKGILWYVDSNNDLWVTDYDNYDGALTATPEPDFEWEAETGDIGIQEPDYKFYQDFQIRLTMEANTKVKIYFQYDSDGEWHLADTIEKKRKGCYTIPIHTPKVDHYKMKIAGKGDCKIYLISKYREYASEVRNIGNKL